MDAVASPASAAGALLLTLQLLQLAASAIGLSANELTHTCRRSDPQLGECIRKSAQEILPKICKGIPELKIAPHDPLKVEKLLIRQGQGPVSLDSTFTNQIFNGLSNLQFTAAKMDVDKNEITLGFNVPYLLIEGDYSMDGRILLVPIKGKGFGRTNYTGVTGTGMLRGHRQVRGGREYLEPDTLLVDIHVKRAHFNLDNLFNGDKLLGGAVEKLLHENWELLFNELKPTVDETVGTLLKGTAQQVFRAFPLDELLPQ